MAVPAAPVYQPPAPRPKSKKTLMIAIVAVVLVVVVVLAAVMFVLPKAAQSTPGSALNAYFDGTKERDAAKIIDCTIMHFDTTNRSLFITSLTDQLENLSEFNVSLVSMEDISMSNVPADIKLDSMNFTTALQNRFLITIQDSQFVKVTIKQTNSSTDSYTSTTYVLLIKVDGKWYLNIYANYSLSDWATDRSMSDRGYSPFPGSTPGISTTPTGSFAGMNSSGYRILTLVSISSSTLSYDDCEVRLTIGTHTSYPAAIPSSMHLTIPVIAGTATGYNLTIVDSGTTGYVSAGGLFTLGPFTSASGLNAIQPTGTVVIMSLIYASTGETIATATFTL
jgi:hypothetical protein